MSVLSDSEIIKCLNDRIIDINPLVLNNIQPSSIDLTLSDDIEILTSNETLDLSQVKNTEVLDRLVLKSKIGDGYILEPGCMVLGYTKEELCFTTQVNGRICNRNSLARWGLDASLGHYINPNFKGRMPLVIRNVGPLKLILHSDMKICQLELHLLSFSSIRNYENRHDYAAFKGSIPSEWEEKFEKDSKGMNSTLSDYLHERITSHRSK